MESFAGILMFCFFLTSLPLFKPFPVQTRGQEAIGLLKGENPGPAKMSVQVVRHVPTRASNQKQDLPQLATPVWSQKMGTVICWLFVYRVIPHGLPIQHALPSLFVPSVPHRLSRSARAALDSFRSNIEVTGD